MNVYETALDHAKRVNITSKFVKGCVKFYIENGFLSRKQLDVLVTIKPKRQTKAHAIREIEKYLRSVEHTAAFQQLLARGEAYLDVDETYEVDAW